MKVPRSSFYYQSVASDQAALVLRIKEIASVRVRYRYRRLHTFLQRDHKRVYRLYKKEGLQMRNKASKRVVSIKTRTLPMLASQKNACCSMDFVADKLFDGSRIRILTIVANFTHESPHIVVGKGIKGHDMISALEEAIKRHGKPQRIKVDNGPEFILKDLDLRAYCNQVHGLVNQPTMLSSKVLTVDSGKNA